MQNGALGDVSWIEQAWIGFGTWGNWRGKKDLGGGRIYDLGAHLIDQALQFFPQPVESVYCRTHYDWPDADIESEATIFINYKNNKTAVVDLSSMSYIDKPRYLVRQHMFACVEGLDGQIDVSYGRRGEHDGIDERIIDGLVKRLVCHAMAVMFGLFAFFGVRRDDAAQFKTFREIDKIRVALPAPASITDDGDTWRVINKCAHGCSFMVDGLT